MINPLGVLFRFLVVDRHARKLAINDLLAHLLSGQLAIEERLKEVEGNAGNQTQLIHIIGIERWGQSRLQVALGDPYYEEEYDNYCPAETLTWEELKQTFSEIRQQTLTLADELKEMAIPLSSKVRHNQLGMMTVQSWLYYLNMHADIESRRLNGQ